MQTRTNLKIVDARPEHAPFIAWVMLTAFRSHLEEGFWDFMRPGTDEELLRYLEALTTTKAPHWAHLPLFIVAEVDGEPAAGNYPAISAEHGGMRLRDGMAEANAATGQTPDAGAIGRALTILNVAPEHPGGVDRRGRGDAARVPAPGGWWTRLCRRSWSAGGSEGDSVGRRRVHRQRLGAEGEVKAGYVVVELTNPEFEAVYKTPGYGRCAERCRSPGGFSARRSPCSPVTDACPTPGILRRGP